MPWDPWNGDCSIVERSEGVVGFGDRECCFLAGAGESGYLSDGCLVVGEDPDVPSFACKLTEAQSVICCSSDSV